MWLKGLLPAVLLMLLTVSAVYFFYPRFLQIVRSDVPKPSDPALEKSTLEDPTQWVETIFLDPVAVSLSKQADLRIALGELRVPVEELEFQVHQLVGSNWQVIQDWVAWPVPPFKSITLGASALQVDIRRQGAEYVQQLWMGDYYFHDDFQPYPSLYRAISSTMFDIDDREALSRRMGDRINLVLPLLPAEPLTACMQACEVERVKGVGVQAKGAAGRVMRTTNKITWPDAPISINLAKFPQFDQIRSAAKKIMPDLDDRSLQIIFVTQIVYRGFWSGSPEQGFSRSHFDALSMCNTYSYSLIRLLTHLGVDADFVSYENEFGGAHAFVQVVGPKQTLLLDAMEGRVIFSDLPSLIAGVSMPSLSLPRFQETGRDIARELPKGRGLWISKNVDFNRGQAVHSEPTHIDLSALRER